MYLCVCVFVLLFEQRAVLSMLSCCRPVTVSLHWAPCSSSPPYPPPSHPIPPTERRNAKSNGTNSTTEDTNTNINTGPFPGSTCHINTIKWWGRHPTSTTDDGSNDAMVTVVSVWLSQVEHDLDYHHGGDQGLAVIGNVHHSWGRYCRALSKYGWNDSVVNLPEFHKIVDSPLHPGLGGFLESATGGIPMHRCIPSIIRSLHLPEIVHKYHPNAGNHHLDLIFDVTTHSSHP